MGLDMNYEAEVFVDTENLSREDWLACRRKGIGGSDAAAIMGRIADYEAIRKIVLQVMEERENGAYGSNMAAAGAMETA